jgi:uncharacterized protein DUF6502
MARPPKRSRTTLTSGSVSAEELFASMEQTLRLWTGFYTRIGATPRSMRAAFAKAQRQAARNPYRMSEANAFEIFRGAGELIDAWYREASYVDELGAPRALPLEGPQSFETLATRFLPDHAPGQVAEFFTEEGLVARLSSGLLKPHRRTAVINRLNAVTLDRFAVLTHGLLGTLLWNHGGRGTEQPRLERQVHATRVPVGLLPEFNAKAKEVGALMISQLENWLAGRQTTRTDVATARVGVSLVAYVEQSPSPTPSRRRTTRKRAT